MFVSILFHFILNVYMLFRYSKILFNYSKISFHVTFILDYSFFFFIISNVSKLYKCHLGSVKNHFIFPSSYKIIVISFQIFTSQMINIQTYISKDPFQMFQTKTCSPHVVMLCFVCLLDGIEIEIRISYPLPGLMPI